MKKLFMLMWDEGQLKVLPYEEGNALPTVAAEDEADARKMAEEILRLKEKEYRTEDIINRAEDLDIHVTASETNDALDYLDWKYDCNLDYWTNIDNAIESATGR